MTDQDRLIEAVARAICTERCAFYGDPPCHALPDFKGCESDERCDHMAAAAVRAIQDITPEGKGE